MPKGGFFKRVLKGGSAEPHRESPSRPIVQKVDAQSPVSGSAPTEHYPEAAATAAVQSALRTSSKAAVPDREPSPRITAAPASTVIPSHPSGEFC